MLATQGQGQSQERPGPLSTRKPTMINPVIRTRRVRLSGSGIVLAVAFVAVLGAA